MRRLYQLLFFLHLIVGIAALKWGISSVFNLTKPLAGISFDFLENTSFNTFLIPALAVIIVLGLGNLYSSVRLVFNFIPEATFNFRSQGVLSVLLSLALIYVLYTRYTLTPNIDAFIVVYGIIAAIQLLISTLMAIFMFFYPARFLIRVLKNTDYFK